MESFANAETNDSSPVGLDDKPKVDVMLVTPKCEDDDTFNVVNDWAKKHTPNDATYKICFLWGKNFRINYYKKTCETSVITTNIICESYFVSVRQNNGKYKVFVHK